jgi:hypothetical protein
MWCKRVLTDQYHFALSSFLYAPSTTQIFDPVRQPLPAPIAYLTQAMEVDSKPNSTAVSPERVKSESSKGMDGVATPPVAESTADVSFHLGRAHLLELEFDGALYVIIAAADDNDLQETHRYLMRA